MSQKYSSLIELLNAWFGGAATTMIHDRRGGRPANVAHERSLDDAPEVLRKGAATRSPSAWPSSARLWRRGWRWSNRWQRDSMRSPISCRAGPSAVHAVVCGRNSTGKAERLNALLPATSAMGPFCGRLSHSISWAKLWTGASFAGGAD